MCTIHLLSPHEAIYRSPCRGIKSEFPVAEIFWSRSEISDSVPSSFTLNARVSLNFLWVFLIRGPPSVLFKDGRESSLLSAFVLSFLRHFSVCVVFCTDQLANALSKMCICAPCCSVDCRSSSFKQSRLLLPVCFPGQSGQRADSLQAALCVCVTLSVFVSVHTSAYPIDVSEFRGGSQVCKLLTSSQEERFKIWPCS